MRDAQKLLSHDCTSNHHTFTEYGNTLYPLHLQSEKYKAMKST